MDRFSRVLPFRYRLTLWYILIFAISLLGFETLSYFEFRADLFAQMDAGLLSALNQATQNIDVENNNLAFQNANESAIKPLVSIKNPYTVRIVDERGNIIDTMKDFPKIMIEPSLGMKKPGASSSFEFQTARSNDVRYRVAAAGFGVPGSSSKNFILVAISLAETESQLSKFLARFFIALPFVLIVATLGGLFLAWRALYPIVAMERLATKVRVDQFSDRLNYRGPHDEIGNLASSFDAMLDRLEASFKREKRFSADASHELKTPLTALKGKMDVALSRSRTAREYETILASMKNDVERLIAVSADLLLLSRASGADARSRFESVEVDELMDSCVDQVIDANPGKLVNVERNYEKGLKTKGVRDYLIRLFLNILDNAVKFSGDEVHISITIRSGGKGAASGELRNGKLGEGRGAPPILIEIADKGCGIPENEVPKLFDPFYRVESDRSRDRGGSGLGLAICKEIVEAHGGEIHIRSSTGKGTTVAVALSAVPRF